MKKRVAFLFLYIPLIIYSQNNGVYVTDVKLINKFENWCWSINQDRQENMIFGVERGVMVFDGINQELIKTPSTPLALYSQESTQKIWVSGNEFMGVLEKNKSATYNYVQLEVKKNSEYSKIIELNDTVYFVSKYSIQRFDAQNNKKIDEIETGELLIDESFVFRNKVYFIIEYFLNTINNNKLNELGNVDFPVDNFTYVIPIGNKEVILGTADRTTYIFNGKSFKTVNLSSPFFDNNVLTGGIIYSDSTIILSSLAGGIAIYNYEKSEIVNQVGYFNGLPDDEIRASFVDNNKGIWLSHEFGISRIDMNQGIESFGYYPGLKGSPIAIKYFNRLLYVATNDGLFILDEIKDYNEFTVMVNVPVNINIDVTETERANTSDNDQEESDQKRGLFGKRNRNKEVEKEAKNNNKHLKNQHQVATKTKLIKKRSLKSISKYFTLIKGMNGKYSQLAAYKNYLLVAGNNGLFAVKGKESEQILKNHYILDVYITDSGNEAYCATDNGLYRVYIKNNKWEIDHFAQTTNTVINSVAQEKTGNMVIASENMLLRGKLIKNNIELVNEIELPENPGQTFEVKYIDEKTYIFDSKRIYEFTQSGQLNEVLTLNINNYIIHNQSKFTWLFNNNQWALYSSNHTPPKQELIGKLKLFGTLRYIDVDTNGYIWLINDENLLLKLTPVGKSASSDFVLRTIKIQSGQHELELNSSINLDARNNNLKTKLSAPFYLLQNGVNFSYKIEGLNDDWSDWSNNSELNYGFIPAGNYALKYKAKNALGMESDEQTILINVPKPFTQTTLFYLILIVVFGAIAYLVMKLRIQKLKKDKEILEQKVKERTATIELQKSRIEKQHDEITGSIRYAKRIQTAMLPHDEIIEAMLPDHFILFNPRDIVSGDFYFFKPVGNKVAFVAADCTGHGVPGGFMSMVGMSFLGEITSQLPTPTASRIVDHLRDKIKLTLGQNEVDSTQKDGMDLAICIIDFDNKQIQYAGAFNPLIMIRDGELEVIKADRQPVAVYVKESVFTNHIIDVRPGDSFYMFSDGFPDQIGGPKQRKFMSKNFKDLLLKHHNLPMPEQKKLYQQALKDWIGDGMQVDDILVIGFRL